SSPVLRDIQKSSLPEAQSHQWVDDLPDAPLLLVANEFLDALPIRQFAQGVERRVTILAGGLAFDRGGDIVEFSPLREEIVRAIADRVAKNGGIALLIDYGHERSGPGDTLQAVRRHGFAPVLADPGEQDLTS